MTTKLRAMLGSILLIATLTLACLPNSLAQGPELPGGAVQVSEEAAKRLEGKVAEAFQQNPSGQFTIHATDEEVTSWVALRVANQPETMIADPQIRFTQGKVFAAVTMVGALPFRLRIALVASAQIVDDQVKFEIEKSSAGPFPVPKALLETLSKSVNETLLEAQLDVQVTSIEILESEAVVAARLR